MGNGIRTPRVSVVIPTYQPGPQLEEVVQRVSRVLDEIPSEIVIVDDGNHPAAAARVGATADSVPNCTVVHLKRNRGQQRATLAGIHRARGELVVTMDDDGGHPPELLPRMLTALGLSWAEGDRLPSKAARPYDSDPPPIKPADLVYGVPARAFSRTRAVGSWLNRWIFRVFFGVSRCAAVTSYRAFRARLLPEPQREPTARRQPIRTNRAVKIRLPRSPNLSAMLLARAPRVQCVSFEPPPSHLTRHSSLSLARALTVLAVYWVPRGLLLRALARRERCP